MAERMIPPGYMTVGEVAKKMGVTVRTLQYYDREGLLSPSAESEGGRRLYADKDVIKLHQILSLKHLGFSLDDIKNRLTALDTPAQVAQALAQQAAEIRGKMDALAESLRELEMLRAEVLQMQTVNFKKYADIIVNLQMKNDFYWIIKHFDDQTLEHIRGRFDRESGLDFLGRFNGLCGEVLRLQQDGIPPDSEAGRDVAKRFWALILEFTGGDMSMLPTLMETGRFKNAAAGEELAWRRDQERVNAYIGPALEAYFDELGIDPLEEGHT